jgi:hypothetical protein
MEPVELYDVIADQNELNDIMDKHPELVVSMAAELKAWLAEDRITSKAMGLLRFLLSFFCQDISRFSETIKLGLM